MNRRELAIVLLFLALAVLFAVAMIEAGAVQFVGELRTRFN